MKLILTLIASLLACSPKDGEVSKPPIPHFQPVITADLAKADSQRQELGEYVLLMMKIVDFKASEARRNALAMSIVNTAMDIFQEQEQRMYFVVLIAIESAFKEDAKSSAGALGLTQIMPQFAREFGIPCGLKGLNDADLLYPSINLVLGACRFKALLDAFDGRSVPALVAYNAGLGSNQMKQLRQMRNIANEETSNYVVRWSYLKELAEIEKVKKNAESQSSASSKDSSP